MPIQKCVCDLSNQPICESVQFHNGNVCGHCINTQKRLVEKGILGLIVKHEKPLRCVNCNHCSLCHTLTFDSVHDFLDYKDGRNRRGNPNRILKRDISESTLEKFGLR